MYQSSSMAHEFNHQPLYKQQFLPNQKSINDIVWNQNNNIQQVNGVAPYLYSAIPNQQSIPDQTYSQLILDNNYYNDLARILSPTPKIDNSSKQKTKYRNRTSNVHPSRLLSRQSSLGDIRSSKDTPVKKTLPLTNSYSTGTVVDFIQKERKSHTMAPLTRITGPSSNITTNMFASTLAPSDVHTNKPRQVTPAIPNTQFSSYGLSEAETTDVVDETNNEDEDDDDAPIVVKVQYDPDAGGPPSEDIIRQAVDNQLKQQSNSKMGHDPIVLNFLKQRPQAQLPPLPVRPAQPMFNRPIVPGPQLIPHPQIRTLLSPRQPVFNRPMAPVPQVIPRPQIRAPISPQQPVFNRPTVPAPQMIPTSPVRIPVSIQQQSQQQRQQQSSSPQFLQQSPSQQFLQRSQQQHQHQWQLQEKQRQQQQELLLRQQKEKQQLQQFLQQHQQQRKQQTQLTQQQQQQRLSSQMDRQQDQQRYYQLLQQQHRQKQLDLLQRGQLIYQQQQRQKQRDLQQQPQNQQIGPYSSLPPMPPRPSRTVPTTRPTTILNQAPNIFPQNPNNRPVQHVSLPPLPLRNPQQTSPANIIKVSNPIRKTPFPTNTSSTGVHLYNNPPPSNSPTTFIPIQSGGYRGQPSPIRNDMHMVNGSQTLPQRPHTAPLSMEMFRPSSASDIPELSRENLSTMLDQIPDLHGRRFSIVYAEPTEPAGFPLPSPLDTSLHKYSDAVIVDKLPKNIMQHVRSSSNKELRAALDPVGVQTELNGRYTPPPRIAAPTKLKKTSRHIIENKARPRQRVKRSPPPILDDFDYNTRRYSLKTETEVIEIEIVSLSKYQL